MYLYNFYKDILITMKSKILLVSVLSSSFILSGCYDNNASTEYPIGLTFQEVDIIIDDSSMTVFINLSSKRDTYLSSDLEQQYITVNNGNQLQLNSLRTPDDFSGEANITVIDNVSIGSPVKTGDELTVSYKRADGQLLQSVAAVPEPLSYVSPINGASYDHATEDISISWQSSETITDSIYLDGECLRNADSSYYENIADDRSYYYPHHLYHSNLGLYKNEIILPLKPNATSFTITANSLGFTENNDSCEITVTLYPVINGQVDSDFAGGTYTVRRKSSLTLTLTNIGESNE